MNLLIRRPTVLSAIAVLIFVLSSCASGPKLRTHYDDTADFSSYRTFGFAEELGTNRAGYSTLITGSFKDAVAHELEARGYTYDEKEPDLVVNFFTRIRQQSDVHTRQSPTAGVGYYGYRYGLYTGWPMYETEVFVDNYRYGTVNVDVVDARREQLIWEGIAEGRLSDQTLQDPESAIHRVVAELFKDYPATAGADPGN